MMAFPVDARVGNVKNDEVALVRPLSAAVTLAPLSYEDTQVETV
jgi:hypothetical protein